MMVYDGVAGHTEGRATEVLIVPVEDIQAVYEEQPLLQPPPSFPLPGSLDPAPAEGEEDSA